MHGIYADTYFDDLDLDARTQWIGRGKQHLSYGIQILHMMVDLCVTYTLMLVSMTLTLTLKTFVRLVLLDISSFHLFLFLTFKAPPPPPFFVTPIDANLTFTE